MNLKKIILIIFFNFILLIFFMFLCDLYVFHLYAIQDKNKHRKGNKFEYKLITKNKILKQEKTIFTEKLRKPHGLQYKNKHSIVIFGCSFAYGDKLNDSQTFAYKLANILKVPTYNRAYPWGSIQEIWYQTGAEGKNDFYNTAPFSDTYIYIMINDHYTRLYSFLTIYRWREYMNYINNKGELKDKLQITLLESILKTSYVYRHIENKIKYNYIKNSKNSDEIVNRTALYINESKNKLQEKNNKEIKFIVILYDQIDYEKKLVNKLRQNGIITIRVTDLTKEDLTNCKYTLSKKDLHPNEKAWDLLTPLIAKKIKEIWNE